MTALPVVVMGVSGVGKSTIGRGVAQRLDVPYVDGDALHSQHNIDKMARGQELTHADRGPWLDRVGRWLAARDAGGVVSCSALLRRYRDIIRSHAPDAWFALLTAEPSVLRDRMHNRDHFMPASLLSSQLATLEPLEPDEHGSMYGNDSIDSLVNEIIADAQSP